MSARKRFGALAAALLLGLLSPLVPVRADGGEAGLVIQNGAHVDTYCVSFSGDSITGAELLAKVNIPVVQWSGLVCAVGAEGSSPGCFHPSSFDTCACQSFPPDNLYWSFFTQKYGAGWVYSGVGYKAAKLRDGDMQAWKWGEATPGSAPSPVSLTFEDVCGHAPQGGLAAATEPPTAVPTPTVIISLSPTSPPLAVATSTVAATASPATPPSALTPAPAASATATAAQPTALVTIQSHGAATATPAPPAAASGSGSSGGKAGRILFGIIIAVLMGAIAGALYRVRRDR